MRKMKKIIKSIGIYFKIPSVFMLLILIILSVAAFLISFLNYDKNNFISSIFGNIFSGIISGLIILLISSINSIILYKNGCIKEYLCSIHEDCLKYFKEYNELITYKCNGNSDEYYNHIYDCLCVGNDIAAKISQSRFTESIPFNPTIYFKNRFSFDVEEILKRNLVLREKIMELDVSDTETKHIRDIFYNMDHEIRKLNGDFLRQIKKLKIKEKYMRLSKL